MAKNLDYFAITPEIERMTALCTRHDAIDPALYAKYDVKRGLRDINGKALLRGLRKFPISFPAKSWTGRPFPAKGSFITGGSASRI